MCNSIIKKAGFALFCTAQLFVASSASAATVTFTPVGSTSVAPGTNVVFEVTVSVESLVEFNTADVLIGSNAATDVAFAYSPEWNAAFSNVTPPIIDTGTYAQDLFVGGNNTAAVGTSLLLGTVTIDTTGMGTGTFNVTVDNSFDGVSTLGLAGEPEPLNGNGIFSIATQTAIPTASEWGLITMMLSLLTVGTLVVRARRVHA